MPVTSQEDLNSRCFLQLVDILAKNKEFCTIAQEVSPDRNNRMEVIIMETAKTNHRVYRVFIEIGLSRVHCTSGK
jgi:hypothetical protein